MPVPQYYLKAQMGKILSQEHAFVGNVCVFVPAGLGAYFPTDWRPGPCHMVFCMR